MSAPRVVLVHWNAAEAQERARRLSAAGFDVSWLAEMAPAVLESLDAHPPTALVIDLSRLPSHGRRVGEVARERRRLRAVPLVFVGGDEAKVARVKASLPDAAYTTWRGVNGALSRAIAHPPAAPVVPTAAAMLGYSGTPLPKKLGIKVGHTVALVGAPEGFEGTLGELPAGVQVRRRLHGRPDVTLFFLARRHAYEHALPTVASLLDRGGAVWIVWPKKSSGVPSELTETDIRETALAYGLVDFKVCAVDATWSGLRLARRRARPSA